MSASLLESLYDESLGYMAEAVTLRRRLHAHPELGLHLPMTQAAILESLKGLGLDIRLGQKLSSVTAILDTGRPGPTVLLRGDMDALPLQEDADVEYASTVPGAMHACCHDSHVAMLVQAAKLLATKKNEFSGRVVFMFQPGEEGFGGARFMIEEGVLRDAGDVDLAFAIHTTPLLPSGWIATKDGALMASSDQFHIEVRGKGGHASSPQHALDPIPVACEIVTALQTMVTRRVNAFDPAVVTVGHITAGTTTNVIPDKAFIEGTIRTVSPATRALVEQEIPKVAAGIAAAHGLEVSATVNLGYPVTVNNALVAQWARTVATNLLDQTRVLEMPTPVMGAEDFSYILEEVPGALVFLGACPDGVNFWEAEANHSNLMVMNEDAMATGIAMYAAVVLAKSNES